MTTVARPRLGQALALPSVLAGVLALVYTPLVFGQVVFSRDVHRLFYPVHAYLVERLRAGELPLWYPYEALGVPFIASAVTAVFHPVSWLSVAFGPVRGIWAGQLVAVAVAVVGAYLLSRRLDIGRPGAALAAVIFGGGGTLVSMLDLQTFFLGPMAHPWLLIGVHLAVSRPTGGPVRAVLGDAGPGLALGGAAVAWILLAGEFQGAMVMGATALAFSLAVVETGARRRALGLVTLTVLLGVLVSAVQLLPTLEIAPIVDRGAGLDWHRVREWSLPPARLTELFLGHQSAFASLELRSVLYPDRQEAWHLTVYFGVTALFGLLMAAPLARERGTQGRLVVALLSVAGLCLWLALGRWGGLYRALFALMPLWDGFRYPEKMVAHAALPIALLAGLGLQRALSIPRRGAVTALTACAALAVAGLVAWTAGGEASVTARYAGLLAGGLGRGALVMGALGLAFFLIWRRGWQDRALVGVVIAGLALFDLAGPNGRILDRTAADPLVLQAPSLVGEWLHRERGLDGPGGDRVTTAAERGLALAMPPDLTTGDQAYLDAMLWSRSALEAGHAATLGFESTTHYLPALSTRHRALQVEGFGGWLRHGARIFGGRYLVLNAHRLDPADFTGHRVALDRADLGIVVLERRDALGRAFVATPHFVDDADAARLGLALPEVGTGRSAVVEARPPPGWTTTAEAVSGSTRLLSYRPERVVIAAELDAPGVLVLNDAWWPGWTATVGHTPVPILRTNYLVRGVLLDAGRHEVVFAYRTPPGVRLGAALSGLGLLALLLAAFAGLRPPGRAASRHRPAGATLTFFVNSWAGQSAQASSHRNYEQ